MNRSEMFAPLRLPQFRWLYTSNLAFFLALGGQGVVRAWLAFQLTESEFALGMIMFTVAVPMFFFAPFGGVLADRMDRRKLIMAAQVLVIASELFVLALILMDKLAFWHLLVTSAALGFVFPVIMPARTAIVVNIVGKHGLGSAIGLNMAGINTTRIVGPALAGFLIDAIGVGNTYMVGVILYVAAFSCMLRVTPSPPEGMDRLTPVWRSVTDGFRYIHQNHLILILLLFGLVPMFLAMPFQNLLVVFADKIWHVGSRGLGILSASAGLGGVAGSIWVASLGYTSKRMSRMMTAMMLFGSLLFAFALSPYFLLGVPLAFLANGCAAIYATLNNTAIQLLIPDNIRGRISSFLMMSFSLPLLGTLPMAAMAEVWGAPFAVALASVLAMLTAVLFYALSPGLRGLDQSIQESMSEERDAVST